MDAMARIRSQRGLMTRIAETLGIQRGAVAMWKRVPQNRIAEVSRITGMTPEELRPDLAELAAQFRDAPPAPAEAA